MSPKSIPEPFSIHPNAGTPGRILLTVMFFCGTSSLYTGIEFIETNDFESHPF